MTIGPRLAAVALHIDLWRFDVIFLQASLKPIEAAVLRCGKPLSSLAPTSPAGILKCGER
jgi:hypothetical protein